MKATLTLTALVAVAAFALPAVAEANHGGYAYHQGERFHESPSFGLAFDLGVSRTLDPKVDEAIGFSNLRLTYRQPVGRLVGWRMSGEMRGDRFGDKLVFSPQAGFGFGIFTAATYNSSFSLDLIGSAFVGPSPVAGSVWAGVQTGLEGGWWWVPAAARHDIGFGFIVRAMIGTDTLRGATSSFSGGLAVQF